MEKWYYIFQNLLLINIIRFMPFKLVGFRFIFI
jgi:hypothetical protein